MTLTFGASDPAQFIDCGTFTGATSSGTGSRSFVKYLSQEFGATLAGRMNVFVKRIDHERTLVRVSARYIFTMPERKIGRMPSITWTFDSGGEATQSAGSMVRTCRPTYEAERAILIAVSD
jgi:hypothetical protein